MFHTNDVPAKPALEKRISRKTKEHLGYRIKNIEEIMGVKYTKDTANRVVKCEVNGRNITEDVDYSFRFIKNAIKTLDRKSTRLNSSHVAISYAVFCMKKKKVK